MNFGAIEPECAAYDRAAFVVIPVPYDLTSTYQSGSRLGPAAILAADGGDLVARKRKSGMATVAVARRRLTPPPNPRASGRSGRAGPGLGAPCKPC